MQKSTIQLSEDKQTDAITAGLAAAYRKMLAFKKYKGTPVVVSEYGQIKYLDADSVLQSLNNEEIFTQTAERGNSRRTARRNRSLPDHSRVVGFTRSK